MVRPRERARAGADLRGGSGVSAFETPPRFEQEKQEEESRAAKNSQSLSFSGHSNHYNVSNWLDRKSTRLNSSH